MPILAPPKLSLGNIPASQALQGLINAAGGFPQSGNEARTAWEFDSNLRDLKRKFINRAGTFEEAGFTSEGSAELAGLSEPGIAAAMDFGGAVSADNIQMIINPKSVSFSQPKRITRKDVREGSVFFHFGNDIGQNNDILTMKFQGNTGNIDLRSPFAGGRKEGADTGALQKLIVWHNLYLLTLEPMLLGESVENEIIITYSSPLMPRPVRFFGFFEQVLEFTESADKPNSRNYSFGFIVTRTYPKLENIISEVISTLAVQAQDGNATTTSSLFSTPT